MRIIRALMLRFILLLIIVFCALGFLVSTNEGLKISLNLANMFLPGTLNYQKIEGRLIQKLSFNSLIYSHKKQKISLGNTKLKWHFVSLYPLNFILDTVEISNIELSEDENNILIDKIKLSGGFTDSLFLDGNTRVSLPGGILNINIHAKNNQLKSKFLLGDNIITLNGPLKGPWNIHAQLPNLEKIHKSLENLKSTLIVDATIYDMQHANLEAKLSPGRYLLPKGSKPEYIIFNDFSLTGKLNPDLLSVNAHTKLNDEIIGRLKFDLPNIQLDNINLDTQKVNGRVQLAMNSINFLEGTIDLGDFIINLESPSGRINAEIDVSGFLNQPKLNGNVSLVDGRLSLPNLGLNLDPIQLNIKTDGTSWEADASIKPNKGELLVLNGKGLLIPEFTGGFTLEGDNVIVMDTSEYLIKASPKIKFDKDRDAFNIDGEIVIPEAKIKPVSFNNTKTLTQDAIFEEDERDPNPLNLNVNISIAMGKDVSVDAKGIQGNIDGILQVKQLPKQALDLNGKLQLRNGKYECYGQKLKIEQGDIIFLGKQISNPNIQVQATRHINGSGSSLSGSNELLDFNVENLDTKNFGSYTEVGINVSGRIDSPKVKLYSNPPNLSQEDILSMLILGKPADQVGSSGGQILFQAMSSMNLGSDSKGMKMMKDFKKSLGVDIDVKNNSIGTSSNDMSKTTASVGKSITKRIYLQYSDGLFQENSSVFTLTYLLNKFLSIKVTSSSISNGLDITYSHSE
ncbi:MAG: translocation/assembly module TamB domain-containing protein [Legionellaceae bacterium]|nr:translocation/assembly module TamB domain-containing protein [Legionellaceae bacterium]